MPLRLRRALHGAQGELPARDLPRIVYYASDWKSAEHGALGGSPVLLIHGFGLAASAYEMLPLYRRFAATRPTFALDLPGFGTSERGPLGFRAETYVRAIRSMIAFIAERHGPVDVVASSLASEHAATAVVEERDAVRALALLSPTGLSDREAPRRSALLRALGKQKALVRFIVRFLTTRPMLRIAFGRLLRGSVDEDLVDYAHHSARRRGAHYSAWTYLVGDFALDRVRELVYAALSVPTVVVYDRDPRTSFERLGELTKRNTHVHAARLTPTSGLPHWDAPDATFALLETHFAGREVPASMRRRTASAPDLGERASLNDVLDDERISRPA